MKPLISYYGGKQRLSSKIVKLLPPHTVYAEPFAGGCSILFAKPKLPVTNSHDYREIINDTDVRLINLYRVLQREPLKFIRRLKLTLYSEEEHRLSKKILNNLENYNDLDKAWAYYINIEQSFSNVLLSGWKRGVYGGNLAGVWKNKLDRLTFTLSRFSEVHIACTDALNFIKQYDSPQTCFYCDPPYVSANMGHYGNYTLDDYNNLINVLSNCQGSFVLSCYDIENVVIPDDWEKFSFTAHASSSREGKVGNVKNRIATSEELGNRTRIEIVYRKNRSSNVRDELKSVLAKYYPQDLDKAA